ncbi:MAG: alpha-L-fucosidase [Planctomycetes bacterium]|nr:alpha-L-fucosidase [Planctomycetota bacterium]
MPEHKYGKGDTGWFQKDRFGLFIHWGLYALPARHEWVRNRECITNENYQKYFDHFDPDLYDPKEWARLAKNAGMKYFVITTKHHEGFCLWDSKYTDYKAPNTPHGKDLLKPMVEAFRAEGIKVGFYYSLLDWHHPDYTIDSKHPQRDDKEFREREKGRDITKYAEYLYNQTEELLTLYKPEIFWYDFSFPGEDGKGREDWQSEKLIAMIRRICPDIIIDNRLDLPGCGDFVTPEQFQPRTAPLDKDGNPEVWEACQTLSGSWGYHRDEQTWKSPTQLIWMLVDGVSKGGNLLLNVGPTGRGEFDYRARERLEKIGEWMKYNSRSIYGCGASEYESPADCRLTYNKETNRLYLHIFNWPFKHIHLKGLRGKIKYAQFLHDASEVRIKGLEPWQHQNSGAKEADDYEMIELPIVKPAVDVPVVELFLK